MLAFLLGEALVGRVDLKADRAASVLRVLASHSEAGVDAEKVAPALLDSLTDMAAWLGLERVEVVARGDLAETLRRHHAELAPTGS